MDLEDRMLLIMLPSSTRLFETQTRQAQQNALIEISLMLRAHKARSGAYPNSLAAAWPEKTPPPNDLFTDKPLIYQRQGDGYLLYSVGINGADDGGLQENRKDDLAIKATR